MKLRTNGMRRRQIVLAQPSESWIKLRGRTLSVGTDFSGVEVPLLALNKMHVHHRHIWSCEKLPAAQRLIKRVFRPTHFYEDAMLRDVLSMPKVDLFISGFPCQPYSLQGKRLCLADPSGAVVNASLQYIEHHKPSMVILENVLGLQFGPLLGHIFDRLVSAGYTIDAAILNTNNFGLPHNRKRLYIVAVQGRDTTHIVFPKPVTSTIALANLITPLVGVEWRQAPVIKYRRENVMRHYAEMMNADVPIWETPIVIDAGSSARYSKSYIAEVPCLTSRRCAEVEGYWVSTKGGPLDISEMSLLQGIEGGTFDDDLLRELNISRAVYGGMLGNCMSLNVLCHLIPRVLVAGGFATETDAKRMTENSGW